MATRLIGTDSNDPWLPDVVRVKADRTHVDDLAGYFDATDVEGALAELQDNVDQLVISGGGISTASTSEAVAGTDTTKAVTPAALKDSRPYVDVRAGGVVGDGTTDDGPALNAFLATNAGRVVVVPAGLVVRTTVPIVMPSRTTLRGHGARLVNACPGINDRLLTLTSVSDVIVDGVELDGDKAGFATATEQRHNVHVITSTRVTLRDIYSHHAKGDGFWIGTDTGASIDVVLDNCTADACHRNGLSIISVIGFKATNCQFINSSGTSPQAGADVEPNTATAVVDDVTFVNCRFAGNAWYGFVVALHLAPTAAQRSITLIGCEMSGTSDPVNGKGVWLRRPNDVRLIGCTIARNVGEGVHLQDVGAVAGPVTFEACTIADNGREGVFAQDVPGVSLVNCHVVRNSATAPNTRDGVNIIPTAPTAGYRIVGCWFDGATQRYGVRTASTNVSDVTLIGNRYGTMGTGPSSLADVQNTRFRAEYGDVFLTGAAAGNVLRARLGAEVNDRIVIRNDGEIRIGDGAANPDVRLYRSAAATARMTNALQVDQAMTMKAALDHDGTLAGFFNTTPIAQPTVTGSKGSNAALGSLITALKNLGLILDTTSA